MALGNQIMSVSIFQKYSIKPPPTKEELERADRIIAEALAELESEPSKTAEEAWAEFERVREEIIKQCEMNGTLE